MYTFLEVERQVKLPRPEAKEAEDKERKNMNRAIHTLVEAIGKDNLRAILRDKVDSTVNDG